MASTDISKLKILIIDSNLFIAKTLFTILEAFGVAKIVICGSLKEAEKNYYNRGFDCFFVDFMIEGKSGINFIKMIRTNSSSKNNSDLPIILDTGVTDVETIMMARDAGVSEIIGKPFSAEQVLQKLENAMNNKREFIEVDEFVGPNRRRHKSKNKSWTGENDRRKSSKDK